MPIDVYILPEKRAPRRGDELVLQFPDDDGYLVFLRPLLTELQKQTGQEIEPYGDAYFCGADLIALRETISRAHIFLSSQPKTWQQLVATRTDFMETEIYSRVRKSELEKFLNALENAAHEAQKRNAFLMFFGD